MKNRTPIEKFIEYFSKQLSLEQIEYLNHINEVIPEKIVLYRDFILSLFCLIHDSYLGDDVIDTDEHITEHFNWCWNTNIENFKKERVFFSKTGEHYYYHLNYFKEIYYNAEKYENLFNKIFSFWGEILTVSNLKTKSDYDVFIEVYKIQDKYLLK